ncbi:MAG: response regulator [Firmicutes bacterium]|nr:response regulator [Bacillota bacterium]
MRLVERVLARRPQVRLVPAMQGSVGWELALEHRPDLVLLDLHPPDIPGEELLQRFRTHPDLRYIPVVVVSANATRTRIQQVRGLGAVESLTKPINVARLLQVVDETLGRAGRPAP